MTWSQRFYLAAVMVTGMTLASLLMIYFWPTSA